jgi:hypothetical protein
MRPRAGVDWVLAMPKSRSGTIDSWRPSLRPTCDMIHFKSADRTGPKGGFDLTSLTCIAWGNRRGSPLLSVPAAIAFGVALAIAPTLALAETQVRGTRDALSVEAQNASVEEILVALSNAFDVEFRSSADLEKRLTGTYQGSLQQVVMRILGGYDFFVKSGENGLEISLLGSGRATAVVGPSSTSKVAEKRGDAAAELSPATNVAERPMPVVASAGRSPTIKRAKGPPLFPAAPLAMSTAPGPALAVAPSPAPRAPPAR